MANSIVDNNVHPIITDDLLENTLGNFGKWQLIISLSMALLKFPVAWFQLGIVFLAPPTQFWCRQPIDYKIFSHEKWMDTITPFGNETNFNDTNHACVMRNIELSKDKSLVPCKWGYDYNRSIIHSSIITEWNLVCNKQWYVDVTQMTLMLGILLGNIIFGVLADKFGRKKILMWSIFMQSICGILSAWSPWFELFLSFRFLMALANGGTMVTSFVMCMEVVGGVWRTIVPILYQIPFGLGNTMMAGLAFYYRDWRELQLVLSLFSAIFILYIWIVPESPRWLLATGRREEAARVMEKAAKLNNINVATVKANFMAAKRAGKLQDRSKMKSLWHSSELRKRTLLLCINWLLCGVTFYGFSQYLGQMGTNIYLTVAIGGLITIPGTLLCVFVTRTFGRRLAIAFANFFIASCFFAILLVPLGQYVQDWPKILFAGLGIIGLSISVPALFLLTGELYPTIMRNAGVGMTSMLFRVGSMFSPFVISLQSLYFGLPLSIFGACALLQGGLTLILPESDAALPDTMKDIEMSEFANNNNIGNYTSVPSRNEEDEHLRN